VVVRGCPLCGFFETLKSGAVIGSGRRRVPGNGNPVSVDRSGRKGIGEEGRCREGARVSGFARLPDGERREAFGFRGAGSFASWCRGAWLQAGRSSDFPGRGRVVRRFESGGIPACRVANEADRSEVVPIAGHVCRRGSRPEAVGGSVKDGCP
jgi:hypothetical protein